MSVMLACDYHCSRPAMVSDVRQEEGILTTSPEAEDGGQQVGS